MKTECTQETFDFYPLIKRENPQPGIDDAGFAALRVVSVARRSAQENGKEIDIS